MGHKLTPTEEEQRLRQATREAHEAMQGLRDAIRDATALSATLTADYQAYHDKELKELANALNAEQNQVSAELNTSIAAAKELIVKQIMAGEAVFDRKTSTVSIRFGAGAFDANVPPPYPEVAPEETHQ